MAHLITKRVGLYQKLLPVNWLPKAGSRARLIHDNFIEWVFWGKTDQQLAYRN